MEQKKAVNQLKELKKLGNNMRLAAENWDMPWKTLVSTILSARTRDETTIKYASILFEQYNSVEKLSKAKLEDLEKIIRPINFYKNKSRLVIACAKKLFEKYNSQVPLDFKELIELPGVGRKTANVFLSEMGERTIGVDTHVSYISQYLNWTNSKKTEEIEKDLKKLFPSKKWKEINPILVRFGKTYTSRKKKNMVLDEIKK